MPQSDADVNSDDPDDERPAFSVANRKYTWDDYPTLHDRVIHSTSHNHMVGHDDPVTNARYEAFKTAKRFDPERAHGMAENMSRSIWAKERYLGKYLLGKHFGNDEAAMEAVRHYYVPKNMEQLKNIIGTSRPVRWVYVHNSDGMNTNKIPYAMSKLMAERFGGEVENGIWKNSDRRNTGASMQDRAGRNFEWYGDIDISDNPKVFIVDDVWITGSTTVSMLEYLHDKGADVRGIVTVAVASNTNHVKPTKGDWSKVLEKSKISTVEEASRVAGLDLTKLTGSELYAYGIKGAANKSGLAAWFERSFGLFEIPGGIFQDPGSHGSDSQGTSGIETSVNSYRKPRQQQFNFAMAYPRLDRMSDDELIVAALAVGAGIDVTLSGIVEVSVSDAGVADAISVAGKVVIAPGTRLVVNIPENVSLHGAQALITAAGGISGRFAAVEYPVERGKVRYAETSCTLEPRGGLSLFLR